MADVDLYTMNVPGSQDTLNLRDSRADNLVSAGIDIENHAVMLDGDDIAGLDGKVDKSSVGVANGVASLDQNGKVPASQLPGGTAGVDSVNGKTGVVVLTASDVGALSDSITLGTAASKDSTNSVTYNSTDLVESGAVYTHVDKKFKATSRTIEDTVGFVGKNIIKIDFTGTQTFGSLSLTNNGDGTITVNGTNDSGQTSFPIFTPTDEYYNLRMKYLPGRLTGCNGGSDTTYYLGACNGTKWVHEANGTAIVDFPGTRPGNTMIYIEVKANQTLNNVIFRPMLVDNNYIDDGEFMPYHETVTEILENKANKSEMSIIDGTGTDADKTTIQLKSGMSATVLKSHQDISNKVDKVDGKGLSTNDYTNDDETKLGNIAVARFGNTAENQSKKIKIKINNESRWMLAFTVTLYKDYKATKVMISGYNFTTSYWHQPKAVILGKSYDGNVNVYFGYDSVNNLWVGFDGGSYKGVSISDVANGFQQISNYDGLFTISEVDTLTTLQTTLVAISTTRVESSITNGNIKIDNVETQVYDDSDIQAKLSTTLTPISGNPISISGLKSTQLAVDPVITFEPIQDLHGQSKPYPAGGGKNLFGNGNVSGTGFVSVDLVKPLSAGIYTLSAVVTSSDTDAGGCLLYDTTNNVNLGNMLRGSSRTSLTFTISIPCEQITFYASTSYQTSLGDTFSFTDIQIESGSTATPYAPYENICPISGYDKIEVLSYGKNLFDKSKVELGKISTITGEDESASDIYRYKDYIYLKSNTRYTIGSTNGQTVRIYYYSDNAYIGTDTFSSATSIDTGNSIKRIRFQSREFQTVKEILQIEEGATATTYAPYHKTTDLSESLGQTVYGGSLDVRTGLFTVTHGVVDLGTKDWFYHASTSSTDTNRFSISTGAGYLRDAKVPNSSNLPNAVCDIYQPSTNTQNVNGGNTRTGYISITTGGNLVITDTRFTSPSDLKTALNGIKFSYELKDENKFTIQLTPHEISLLEQYAYVSTNGTTIALKYHNGETASLADVEKLGGSLEFWKTEDSWQIFKGTQLGASGVTLYAHGAMRILTIDQTPTGSSEGLITTLPAEHRPPHVVGAMALIQNGSEWRTGMVSVLSSGKVTSVIFTPNTSTLSYANNMTIYRSQIIYYV